MSLKGIFFLVVYLFFTLNTILAQVVIGSVEKPVTGALLQLKENENEGANSTKGLLLPRVLLTDINSLSGISGSELNPLEMSGLTVYSIDKCKINGAGVYVWTGEKWNKIGGNRMPGIEFQNDFIEINSGIDGRGTNTSAILTTTPVGIIDWSISGSSKPLDPISFINPNTLNGSFEDGDFEFLANPMVVTPDVPWKSLENTMTFIDECDVTKTITLNQTNYALTINDVMDNNLHFFYLNENDTKNLSMISNLRWNVKTVDPGVLLNVDSFPEGDNLTDGTTTTKTMNVSPSNLSNTKRYYTASLIFVDGDGKSRIKDMEVSFMNCFGEVDFSTSTTNINVDQDGNTFYSSLFGEAGEWMVTNLAAKTYDPVRTSSDVDIANPMPSNPSCDDSYDKPLWAYPSSGGNGNSNTDYLSNPMIGLLYNWNAATNMKEKGTSTDRPALGIGSGGTDEGNNPTDHLRIQGICPSGWHLPSDKEWTQLENVLLNDPKKYSYLDSIKHSSLDIFHQEADNRGARVDENGNIYPVGTVMKDPCEDSPVYYGKSIPALEGGFAALRVGYGRSGVAYGWGTRAFFHTSTSGPYRPGFNEASAYNRCLLPDSEGVYRYAYSRVALNSVRCKKD